MPEFTHQVVNVNDKALIKEMYELGRDNPIDPKYACSPFPHPLLEDYQKVAASPNQVLLAIFDEDGLRAGVGVRLGDGAQVLGIFKRYGDGTTPTPEGLAAVQYQTEITKQFTGGVVKTETKNQDPDVLEFYEATGVEVVEPEG